LRVFCLKPSLAPPPFNIINQNLKKVEHLLGGRPAPLVIATAEIVFASVTGACFEKKKSRVECRRPSLTLGKDRRRQCYDGTGRAWKNSSALVHGGG